MSTVMPSVSRGLALQGGDHGIQLERFWAFSQDHVHFYKSLPGTQQAREMNHKRRQGYPCRLLSAFIVTDGGRLLPGLNLDLSLHPPAQPLGLLVQGYRDLVYHLTSHDLGAM